MQNVHFLYNETKRNNTSPVPLKELARSSKNSLDVAWFRSQQLWIKPPTHKRINKLYSLTSRNASCSTNQGRNLLGPAPDTFRLPPPKRMVRQLDLESKAAAQQSMCWLAVQAASRTLFPGQTPSTMPMLIQMSRRWEGRKLTRTVSFRHCELYWTYQRTDTSAPAMRQRTTAGNSPFWL